MRTSKISTCGCGNNNARNNRTSIHASYPTPLPFLVNVVSDLVKIWYTYGMKKHWSVEETELAKDPEAYAIWKLEQRINLGIGEPMINRAELSRYFKRLDIDPWKRRALALALET
jgi:hypothetical protein